MKIIKYKFWPQNRKQVPEPSTKAGPSVIEPVKPKIRKKALLIGIQDVRDEPPLSSPTPSRPLSPLSTRIVNIENFATAPIKRVKTKRKAKKDSLRGPHRDVNEMRKLLIDLYEYHPSDITVLIDNDLPDQKQPTHDNIMEEMKKLVEGAQATDHFFFHFSGHSVQEDTDDISEEDGKNEFIETSDGKRIQDDTLKEILVEPLPSGCFFIAVFDSCHSGSLLDLVHFRCNRIYVPWINKGNRKTNSLWNCTQRKRAKISMPAGTRINQTTWAQTSIDQVLASPSDSLNVRDSKPNGVGPVKKKTKLSIVTDDQTRKTTAASTTWLDSPNFRECMSPVELYCHGFCREGSSSFIHDDSESKVLADVFSISSAQDDQLTWEDKDGSSMTQVMVKILRKDPHPTLEKLMTLVSHDIHDYYVDMHARNREYKKKFKIANEKASKRGKKPRQPEPVEMNNFQNPELSSERPLDMQRPFCP